MKNSILILLLLCFAACEKGEPGKDGTANVKNTNAEVKSTDWNYTISNSYFHYSMPEITLDILATGVVSCYIYTGDSHWRVLPASFIQPDGKELIYSYSIGPGEIVFSVQFDDYSAISNIGTQLFKVVIISGQ